MKEHPKRLAIGSTLAAVLLVGLVFSSWLLIRPSTPTGKGGGPGQLADPVMFPPSISYTQALRLITDLGLQPTLACPPQPGHYTPGSTLQPQPVWQPVGQRETFIQTHQIWVQPTFSASLDWRLRLVKIPGVHFGTSHYIICSQVVYGTPPPGVIMPLSSTQAGIYVHVAFTSSQTYDAALYAVSNLGLGLATYCYEQAEIAAGRGPAPSWQSAGQEDMFARTHTLIVKTATQVTSSLWQTQLQTQSGAVSIQANYTSTCLTT